MYTKQIKDNQALLEKEIPIVQKYYNLKLYKSGQRDFTPEYTGQDDIEGKTIKLSTLEMSAKAQTAFDNENYTEAIKYASKAAEEENADSQYLLGICNLYGYGVTVNKEIATKWFEKAKKQGHKEASKMELIIGLGNMFNKIFNDDNDYDDDNDEFKIIKFSNRAVLYYNKNNYVEAIKYARKAAEYEDKFAEFILGKCYYDGKGVKQNYPEAVNWLRKAAYKGITNAQCLMGVCYEIGRGVEQSNNMAEYWYTLAAEGNDPQGQFYLGLWYAKDPHNLGISPNWNEAVKWYRKAAEQGYKLAQEALNK